MGLAGGGLELTHSLWPLRGGRVSTLAKCNVDNSVRVRRAEVPFPQISTEVTAAIY